MARATRVDTNHRPCCSPLSFPSEEKLRSRRILGWDGIGVRAGKQAIRSCPIDRWLPTDIAVVVIYHGTTLRILKIPAFSR